MGPGGAARSWVMVTQQRWEMAPHWTPIAQPKQV
jgi:hypothetical protein